MQVATDGIDKIGDQLTLLVIAAAGLYVIFSAIKLLNSGRWDELRENIAKIGVAIAIAVLAGPIIDFLVGLVQKS